MWLNGADWETWIGGEGQRPMTQQGTMGRSEATIAEWTQIGIFCRETILSQKEREDEERGECQGESKRKKKKGNKSQRAGGKEGLSKVKRSEQGEKKSKRW